MVPLDHGKNLHDQQLPPHLLEPLTQIHRKCSEDLSHGLSRASHCTPLVSQPAAALTSVAHHPVEPRIYTAALDGFVRCYDLKDSLGGAAAQLRTWIRRTQS